jgi:aspartate/methionine/tyrosine aminotransferase
VPSATVAGSCVCCSVRLTTGLMKKGLKVNLTQEVALPQIARHLDSVGFSDIVQIRNKVMSLRAAGKPVYGFHGGEPDFETPQQIKDAMARALQENKTRYAPSSGIDPLREAIAKKLRRFNAMDVTAEDVLITVGGIQGLTAAFEAALDPGDDILVFSPYWTPVGDIIAMAGARAVLVSVEEFDSQGITPVLESYLTPKTKAIYYNTPANPSGHVFNLQDAEQVAAFALAYNLTVIADEAYEDIVYADGGHISIATLPHMAERTITCFTLSKSYAMTGWRIGYVVAPSRFMQSLQKVILYTTNGVSTPTQWAALAAFEIGHEFFAEKRDLYRKRRDVLVAGLNELGLHGELPGGSFYHFPRVDTINTDSRNVANLLLEHASIATIPGSVFGVHGEGHIRFGFAVPMQTIEQGLEALRKFLAQ